MGSAAKLRGAPAGALSEIGERAVDGLLQLSITDPAVLVALTVISAALTLLLLIRPSLRRIALSLLGLALGGALGAGVFWWLVDVQDVFGVTLSGTTRLWVVLGFGGCGLAIANLFAASWWRRAAAILAIPLFLITSAAQVNADFGAYQNLGEAFGTVQTRPLTEVAGEHGEVVAGTVDYAQSWRPPAGMPRHGTLGEVAIPGTRSGFPARQAVVWLPPAALTNRPPVLPVLVVLSGQPGEPAASFASGHLDQHLDAFAAAHHGIAPIVVAADQLSAPDVNPMCVDSAAFGNSATYLTQDVPDWIRAHYRVSSDPRMWGIEGFSQGGTCVSQIVAANPGLFGSGIASLSQLGPILRDAPQTVSQGFGGSQAAYDAAQPVAIMRAGAPYRDTMLVFGTGAIDQRFTGYARTLHEAAQRAGIDSRLIIEPTGHDWHTVQSVFEQAFPEMAARMGIDRA